MRDFELRPTENGLGLYWLTAEQDMQPLVIDFHRGKNAYRAQHSSLKSEAVAKAVGVTGKRQPHVVDATAGLARDALVLARFGCQVTLIERNATVRQLLDDAITRAQQQADDIATAAQRMTLAAAASVIELAADSADVVYLDPMYPKTGKQKAQVKKDMQMFQQLVGDDSDADELLVPALQVARYRVVVKRPSNAPFLAGKTPDNQLKSKKHRFDIYINEGFTT